MEGCGYMNGIIIFGIIPAFWGDCMGTSGFGVIGETSHMRGPPRIPVTWTACLPLGPSTRLKLMYSPFRRVRYFEFNGIIPE